MHFRVPPPLARGSLVRLASTASTAAPAAPAPPTTTYMPPKQKQQPKQRAPFFATLGKVFAALLVFPALVSIVFPSLLAFLVPAATLLTVGAVLLFTAALALGFVLPLLLLSSFGALVPTAIVYNELNKMRNAKKFDSVAWEIVKPTRHWHFSSDSHNAELTVSTSSSKKSKKVVVSDSSDLQFVGPYAGKAVDYFVDIGAIVETEIMRRDLMGHADTAGYYGNVVAIKGKNIGFFGPLMAKVEIPIDRAFIRSKIAERTAAAKSKK
ncbi:hypothetical protein BDR26DRAFT_857665 [Obelidium mucronatum]|nr:hypothetical protein BDR26DRAFT_857665 [Obelidium mucronatum]